jgi:hypothetical protein
METMVLSVRQPWAWLIVNGWKNIENRDWPTKVRGRVLIHASAGLTRDELWSALLFVDGWAPELAAKMPRFEDYKRGGIVGAVTILDCVEHHSSEWFCGRYGFVLADAVPLVFEPCKGQLGFWKKDHCWQAGFGGHVVVDDVVPASAFPF